MLPTRHAHTERGIAMVLALFLMSAMSVLAASLMFLSQTETYATMNYRMMSQARYAAEAGIQKASDFLLDTANYVPPGPGNAVGDVLASYNTSVSPVQCNAGVTGCTAGGAVILSASPSVPSNYPITSVKTAFDAAAKGSLSAGNATLTYGTYATLIAMQSFESYGGTQQVVQTWQITADGTLSSSRNATVQVVALVETPKVPANSYAAFATSNACGALHFHGNVDIDSYDSTIPFTTGQTTPTTSTSGGNVGTNGNFEVEGNAVDVMGNLYTPRTGVGACVEGSVTALTGKSGTISGSIVQLPAAVNYPVPTISGTPWLLPAATLDATLLTGGGAATCTALGLTYGNTTTTPAGTCDLRNASGQSALAGAAGPFTNVVIDGHGAELTLPSITVSSGVTLTFAGHATPPGNFVINSLAGSGEIAIEANMGATNANESVVMKVTGKNADGTEMAVPFDLEQMGWKQNAAANAANKYDASAWQIVYGGSATIKMDGGNSQSAATIYAPNANFILKGTQDLFGSVLARTIVNGGNSKIHYDRRLSRDFWVAGHPMAGTFTWKRAS